jgi:hypothetical protein
MWKGKYYSEIYRLISVTVKKNPLYTISYCFVWMSVKSSIEKGEEYCAWKALMKKAFCK